jgi:hypothetical protein
MLQHFIFHLLTVFSCYVLLEVYLYLNAVPLPGTLRLMSPSLNAFTGSFQFCVTIFFKIHYSNASTLYHLSFQILSTRRSNMNVSFIGNVCSTYKFCPFLLENDGIGSPGEILESTLFTMFSHVKFSLCWMCINCQ